MQSEEKIKKAWKMLMEIIGDVRRVDYPVFSVTGKDKGRNFSAKANEDDCDVISVYRSLIEKPSCEIDINTPRKIKYKDFKSVIIIYREYVEGITNTREAMRDDNHVTTYVISLINYYNLDKLIYDCEEK